MSFTADEASYLGGSPRRPLPTTSFDHADLVAPMGVLDLSDAEDDVCVQRHDEGGGGRGGEGESVAQAVANDPESSAKGEEQVGAASNSDSGVAATPDESSENGTHSLDAAGTPETTSRTTATASSAIATSATANSGTATPDTATSAIPTPDTATSGTAPSGTAKHPASPGGKKKAAGRVVASRYMSEVSGFRKWDLIFA